MPPKSTYFYPEAAERAAVQPALGLTPQTSESAAEHLAQPRGGLEVALDLQLALHHRLRGMHLLRGDPREHGHRHPERHDRLRRARPGRDRRVVAVDSHDPVAGCRSARPVSSYWTSPLKPFAFSGTNARSMPLNIMRRPGPEPSVRSSWASLRFAHEGRERRLARLLQAPLDAPLARPARRRSRPRRSTRARRAAAITCAAARLAARRDHVAGVGGPCRRAPRERALARLGQPLALGGLALLAAVGEVRQHLLAEQLERLADVLVPVRPGLLHEDHLVDAGVARSAATRSVTCSGVPIAPRSEPEPLLEDLHPQRPVVGVDDLAREAVLGALRLELVPDVRDARPVVAEHVVVGERVAEEVGAVDAALDRGLLVLVAHHRQHDREVRVDREAGGHALVGGDERVVLVDPLLAPARAR